MTAPLEAVLLGAGSRGYYTHGMFASRNPRSLRYVAVAEPDPRHRDRFGDLHGIPAERRYASWEELIGAGQISPALVNTTPDRVHLASTVAALEAGYHVLLEKPMATSPEECVRIVRAAEARGRILQINHGLRYAPFFALIREVVESGRIGQIVSYAHSENVAYWHLAHSYVRGNWRRAETSGPMVLTKCCHDLDLIVWYTGSRARRVVSFGSRRHFGPRGDGTARVGPEVPERCVDGCPRADACPYYAPRHYLSDDPSSGFIRRAASVEQTPEALLEAITVGPYGRCVYRCDNDVVDNQVVLIEMEDRAHVSLTMQGFSDREGRQLRIDGTLGTLLADQPRGELDYRSHLDGRREVTSPGRITGGHGGGDDRLLADFVETVRAGRQNPLTSARVSLESHLLAFAAEESRLTGRTIEMEEYRARFG